MPFWIPQAGVAVGVTALAVAFIDELLWLIGGGSAAALHLDGRDPVPHELSAQMFQGLSPWLQWLPGRLVHTNIVGCGIFAAVSGSSAATVATIGKIALPELKKRGYDERLSLGTLAGSGTLGLLIPPSIRWWSMPSPPMSRCSRSSSAASCPACS
jgi:hypothetical protein